MPRRITERDNRRGRERVPTTHVGVGVPRRGLPLSSQDLEAEWLVVAELPISPDADADEVLTITKWWRETGDVSIPAKLKNYADRLRREFHSLNEQSLEIPDELEAVAPALVNPSLVISK
jgi:hypothetical protein